MAAILERKPRVALPDWQQVRAIYADVVSALDRRASPLVLLGSCVVVWALYGRALEYSFFFDDTMDLTRVEGRSYWSLLASSEGYSYYRPIPFLIWKFLRDVQGHYDQATLHALPLIVHAFNGWLLYLLVRRSGAGQWAIFPALLFLTAPFHYQTVPIVGTLFHPLAGMAMLASVTLYQAARSPATVRSRCLHGAALCMTVVALWAHESGIVIAALVPLTEASLLWRSDRRRPSVWLGGHLLAALAFFVVWSTVEKAPFGEKTDLRELHPKALFFLQGFTYPMSAQINWLHDQLGVSLGIVQVGAVALLGVMAAYGLSAWRRRQWELLAVPVLGLAIDVAASAPSMARLSWAYVEDAPRLLYLVTIGASIFWGLLPALSFGHARIDRIWRVATIALLLGVVVQSWRFVDVRMEMFARGSATIDAIVAEGQLYRGQPMLYLNAPSWFAENRYEYPYGHFGVQLVPAYIGIDRLIYTSSARVNRTDARSASWQPAVSAGRYPFGPHGPDAPPETLDGLLREGRELVVVTPKGADYAVRNVGRLVPGVADESVDAIGEIANSVSLEPARVALLDGQLVVYLNWNVLRAPGDDYDTVIEVRDAEGLQVARYEGYALAGASSPRLWRDADRIEDSIAFEIPSDGVFSIWVALEIVNSSDRASVSAAPDSVERDGFLRIAEFDLTDGQVKIVESAP